MDKVVWSVRLKGARYVSQRPPVVVGDRVLLTFYHGAGGVQRGTLLCADVESGTELWRLDDEQVLSQPVIENADSIHVTSLGGTIYKINSLGEILWKAKPSSCGVWKPVVCGGGVVFAEMAGSAKRTWAVSKTDGSVIWSYQSDGHRYGLATNSEFVVHSTAQGSVFDSTQKMDLHCINAADGRLLWKMPYPQHLFNPTIIDDHIFIGSRGHVVGVGLQTGKVIASHNISQNVAVFQAPLATAAGIVFCAENGSIFSLNLTAAQEQETPSSTPFVFAVNWTADAGGAIKTAPVLGHDEFYVISEAGDICTFAIQDGKQIAKTNIPRFERGFGIATIGRDVIVAASRESVRMALEI